MLNLFGTGFVNTKLNNTIIKEFKLLNSLILIFPTTTSLIWAGLITALAITSIILDQIQNPAEPQQHNQEEFLIETITESPQRELTLNRL
jgi:choline-glycine betaine transporter